MRKLALSLDFLPAVIFDEGQLRPRVLTRHISLPSIQIRNFHLENRNLNIDNDGL
jgi:hypothetical protein